MFELTIKEQVFQFRFGMGFLREIDKTLSRPIEGASGERQNVGATFKISCLFDSDLIALAEILEAANKTENPRVTRNLLDYYIDNECDDIDKLFGDVLGFLRSANATKKITEKLEAEVERQKAKQTAEAK